VDLAGPQALPHTVEAPRLARRSLASVAGAWPAGFLDLVVLLTSELVTNAVIHGRRPVELRLTDDGNQITVEISDGDPHRYRQTRAGHQQTRSRTAVGS
jgi:anti-sigma regulatory factor (Ser/Thr protein kinase)